LAAEIRVRDLICKLKAHQEMAEMAERQPQQWREQGAWPVVQPRLGHRRGIREDQAGVLGREEPHFEDKPEKWCYYKRKRPLHPAADSRGGTEHSAEAATALTGVLDFLSDEGVSEDEVARFGAC
jgi:hypothetical protein